MKANPPRPRGALPTMRLWLALLVSVFSGSCGAGSVAPVEVLVFAASDLQPVLPEVVRSYEERGGGRVRLVFGSSGGLATQIENGAPAAVFLAANEHFVDRLIRSGHIDPASRTVYARGRLAIVSRSGVRGARSMRDLASPEYEVIAIANPEHAPYGVAAREALERSGVAREVTSRLVLADNVAQAYRLVESGSADAGIVALSLVLARHGTPGVPIPEQLHGPLRQTGGVVRGIGLPAEAHAFLRFLAEDPDARDRLARFGFEVPAE